MRRLIAICAATATLLVACTGPDDTVRTAATSSSGDNEQGRSAQSSSTPSTTDGNPSTSDGDQGAVDDTSPRSCRADELQPRLARPTQDVVALGEPITVSIELENVTSEPCARPTEWSIMVTTSDGVGVIGIKTLLQCIDPCQLPPGEEMALTEDWEQIGFDAGEGPEDLGTQYEVGPGEYELDVTVPLPGLPADESVRLRRTINVDPA